MPEETNAYIAAPRSPVGLARSVGLLLALMMSACATSGPRVIESSSTSLNRQADQYEQQARELQRSGSGQAGLELQRFADKQRLEAKRRESGGLLEGAVDLLVNSLFESWLASSPKGRQK